MIHTFPKGICPKVNVIARLEYELHRFNHYTTRTPKFLIQNISALNSELIFQMNLVEKAFVGLLKISF